MFTLLCVCECVLLLQRLVAQSEDVEVHDIGIAAEVESGDADRVTVCCTVDGEIVAFYCFIVYVGCSICRVKIGSEDVEGVV